MQPLCFPIARVRRVGLACLILASVKGSLWAGEAPSLAETTQRAKRIVVATVIRTEVRLGPAGNPYTYTDFQLDETVKGDLPKMFGTRVIGGKLSEVEVSTPFEKSFVRGRRYVLFLGATNADGFVTITPSLLEVREGSKGREPFIDGPVSLPVFEKATGKAYTSRPSVVPLKDFLYSIRRHLQAAE